MIGLIILAISAIIILAPLLFALVMALCDYLEHINPLLPFSLLLTVPLIGLILALCGI